MHTDDSHLSLVLALGHVCGLDVFVLMQSVWSQQRLAITGSTCTCACAFGVQPAIADYESCLRSTLPKQLVA